MRGSYVAGDVPPQPDDCFCDGQPRHIHHPWAWRENSAAQPPAPRAHNCRFEYCTAPAGECENPE